MTDATAPFDIGPALFEKAHLLGSYRRVLPVSAERLFENLLDWEHLPWLHSGNFGSVALVGQGPGWWSAKVGTARESEPTRPTSVVLDAEARHYVVRNDTEFLFVQVSEEAPRQIVVEVQIFSFHPPKNEAVRQALFTLYHRQFATLTAEDTQVMVERQDALDRMERRDSEVVIDGVLGRVDEVRSRVPFQTTWRGTRYWVVADVDGFRAHAADCPHMLGPLSPAELVGPTCRREVRCPWHDYWFDVVSGTSSDGRGLKLRPAFRLEVVDEVVRVIAPTPG